MDCQFRVTGYGFACGWADCQLAVSGCARHGGAGSRASGAGAGGGSRGAHIRTCKLVINN